MSKRASCDVRRADADPPSLWSHTVNCRNEFQCFSRCLNRIQLNFWRVMRICVDAIDHVALGAVLRILCFRAAHEERSCQGTGSCLYFDMHLLVGAPRMNEYQTQQNPLSF